MAAGQLGIYAVPINWHFTPEEAGYILADSGAKVLVAHSDLLAQIASGVPGGVKVLVVPTPEEIAAAYNVPAEKRHGARRASRPGTLSSAAARPIPQPPKLARGSMIYTSGTTGRPKGVRRRPSTPEQQALAAGEAAKYWGVKADPVDRRADERPDVSLRAGRLRHGQRTARPQHGAAAALRGRGHAAPDRPPQGQPHAHRADHVRAPAAPARRR